MNFMKKNKAIIGVTAGVIAIAVIVTAILLTGEKIPPPVTPLPDTSTPSSDVVVKLPTDDPVGTESPDVTEKENDDGLVIDVGGNPEPTTGNDGSKNNDIPVKSPEKPVDTKKPDQPVNTDGGGIQIGGDSTQDEQKAAAQAWIRNLELEGCPYCGGHDCPSFYALDEWGNPFPDVTLCPEYDERNDPIKYCQISGKRTGDGTNGTCVRFVNPDYCPNCGEYVEANTCHTCDD